MSAEQHTGICHLIAGKPQVHAGRIAPANSLLGAVQPSIPAWSADGIAGRLVEVTGGAQTAALTVCARLVLETQQAGGLVAWLGGTDSSFYPPDFAESGIDFKALAVVRVPDAHKAWHACDTLLRCGGFALVALDLNGPVKFPLPVQTRLTGLAKRHNAALVILTREARRDMRCGSMVSLRVETEKHRAGHDCFVCDSHAVKDKRGAQGWKHGEVCRGSDGLC